jgi:hypothetical protein
MVRRRVIACIRALTSGSVAALPSTAKRGGRTVVRKLKTTLVATVVLALAIPAAAEARSIIDLPDRGKVVDGLVRLTVKYSCPATTSPDDALLWLYSSQDQPTGITAGDTAVDVICNGKQRKYRASLGPNIGAERYIPGTVSVQAALGYSGQLASDSADIVVR